MILKNAIIYRRFNSGGPGGQHQNTTENAIEASLTRQAAAALGIDPVSATASLKSQHSSKKAAQKALVARVRAAVKVKSARGRYSAGTDRIRNYHQPNDRITDASGLRWSWRETIGKGSLTECIDGRRAAMAAR